MALQAVAVQLAGTSIRPKVTVPPESRVPVMVTLLPPENGPWVGLTPVTTGGRGGGVRYVKTSPGEVTLVPAAVVAVTSTCRAVLAGEMTVHEVSVQEGLDAAVAPNRTTAPAGRCR